MTVQRPRVAVVFGGRSSEHSVSCVSAGSVLRALDPDRYDVSKVGITTEGAWTLQNLDPSKLVISDGKLPQVEGGVPVALSPDPQNPGLVTLVGQRELFGIDVVFPVLHGPFGEDGTIQGLLSLYGLPYVGSGVLASSAGMDKQYTKTLLAASGLNVAPGVVLHPGGTVSESDCERLGLPVFVKPARGGSSIGISKVNDFDELEDALTEAFEWDSKVLVEAAVAGREVECGVLAGPVGDEPHASVPAEIHLIGDQEWYDYDAKYVESGSDFTVPADLSDDVTARLRTQALKAFRALDCTDLARVDFFVQPDGSLVVNEINTMPGFTAISMFPKMWDASGLAYEDLVDRLVTRALQRGPRTG